MAAEQFDHPLKDSLSEQELLDRLCAYNQHHILTCLELLPPAQRTVLLDDVRTINLEQLAARYRTYRAAAALPPGKKVFDTADIIAPPFDPHLIALGEEYLRAGKVGIFLVAGGQGSRLGFKGPKGCYPISPVRNKSLFRLFAEAIAARARRYGTPLPWYIMTSRDNDAETRRFFRQHDFFGLNHENIMFLVQGEIPSLDLDGRLLIGRDLRIFKNPDGHGGSLRALKESGALRDMRERGIEEIFYFQVDNPLAKIADPLFIGAHVQHQAEMSTKVVQKTDPEEKVGIIGKINGKIGCIEYSELTPAEITERREDGTLRFSSANIAIHMIKRTFVEHLTQDEGFSLPYHVAIKDIECLAVQDGQLVPKTRKGLKFEMFVFDALGFATRSITLQVKREEEFSPVKNFDGADSPQTARQAMVNLFVRWIKQADASVRIPENFIVEISPLFALDAAEFAEKFAPPPVLSSPLYIG
jgi:UDP-N-acetylglucosamine/UDP-N-acetylgalactosamine diphosphorylase